MLRKAKRPILHYPSNNPHPQYPTPSNNPYPLKRSQATINAASARLCSSCSKFYLQEIKFISKLEEHLTNKQGKHLNLKACWPAGDAEALGDWSGSTDFWKEIMEYPLPTVSCGTLCSTELHSTC